MNRIDFFWTRLGLDAVLLLTVAAGCGGGEVPEHRAESSATLRTSRPEPFRRFRDRERDASVPIDDGTAEARAGEVPIGWFGPSDPDDPVGGGMWTGAVIAVDERNAAGGCGGLPVRLVPTWSTSPWANGASLVARLCYDARVVAIVGSLDGPTTHLAEQVVAKARVVLLSPVATDKSVNLAGVPWMFSVAPADDAWADALAGDALRAAREGGEIAVLRSIDHDSRLASNEILNALLRHGRVPSLQLDFRPGETEFAPHLELLARLDPSVLVVVAGAADSAAAVRAVRGRGHEAALYGGPAMGRETFWRLAGRDAEGVRFPLLFDDASGDPAVQRFVRAFRRRAGRDPDYAAAHTYDAVRLLLEAVARAGAHRARVRDALCANSPVEGVTGRIEWDASGQNRRRVTRVATVPPRGPP